MAELRRRTWLSNIWGALLGTALFYAVLFLLLLTGTLGLSGMPSWSESAGIFGFFFAVRWVSKRPLS